MYVFQMVNTSNLDCHFVTKKTLLEEIDAHNGTSNLDCHFVTKKTLLEEIDAHNGTD